MSASHPYIDNANRAGDIVTVGLASYNRPQLLKRAIASIKSQTYQNLEILVSDNGSTDPQVVALIEEFSAANPRVKVFLQNVNQGPFFNFRTLLENATGKYFIWLADDDYWCDSFLENLVLHARQSGAALTYGKAIVVDVDLPEKDCVAKELQTSTGCLTSLIAFARFDSDSIFYGLFETRKGQRCKSMLRDWYIPRFISSNAAFLKYDFVSYVFLYGLLATGAFCNASSQQSIHYLGGRSPVRLATKIGGRHLLLIIANIIIHLQMLLRMLRVSLRVSSFCGLLLAPVITSFFVCRRIVIVAAKRFR